MQILTEIWGKGGNNRCWKKSYILVFGSWSANKTSTKCLRICILDTGPCTQPIVLLANKDTFTNYTSCNSKTFNLQVFWPAAGVLTHKVRASADLFCKNQQTAKSQNWHLISIGHFLGERDIKGHQQHLLQQSNYRQSIKLNSYLKNVRRTADAVSDIKTQ